MSSSLLQTCWICTCCEPLTLGVELSVDILASARDFEVLFLLHNSSFFFGCPTRRLRLFISLRLWTLLQLEELQHALHDELLVHIVFLLFQNILVQSFILICRALANNMLLSRYIPIIVSNSFLCNVS